MIQDILKWNETDQEIGYQENLQVLLHKTALENKDQPAAVDDTHCITYGTLDQYSNAVCRMLLQKYGEDSHARICVYCSNCVEKICYIVGIIKAGMTYVPLDVNLPEHRNEAIIQNVQPACLLTDLADMEHAEQLAKNYGLSTQNVVVLTIADLQKMDGSYIKIVTEKNRVVYIIHTSGSTGVPKGVCIPECALLNFCWSIIRLTGITSQDRTAIVQNPSFDVSIMDMFPFLLVGATLFCIPNTLKKDIHLVNRYLIENQITMQTMSTALYHLFIEEEEVPPTLKKVFVIGEKMLKYAKKPYRIYNMYGPTEATVLVTFMEVTEQSDNIPIGFPIDNTKILIVKEDGTLADVEEQGEICITGANLALGYLNNPEETQKRFVPSVLDPKKRMYRTGDIGMWSRNGMLYCYGRIDFQVKHRGYRIELDEIRHHILQMDSISDCAILYHTHHDQGYIVCFYCAKDGTTVTRQQLIQDLSTILPEYMIPGKWISISSVPLNNNGKIDRNALFDILRDRQKNLSHTEKINSKQHIETVLRELWADMLDIDPDFSDTESFRNLGGHSILGMMMKRLKEEQQIEISFMDFLDCKTFRDFVQLVECSGKRTADSVASESAVEDETIFPLSAMQIAYLTGREKNMTLGTIPTHMYCELVCTDFVLERFLKALQCIFQRHPGLRTRMHTDGEQWVVPNYELTAEKIGFQDLRGKSARQQAEIHQNVRAELERFCPDLEKELLVKTVLLQLSEKKAVFCVYLDSIVVDGWSMNLLQKELYEYDRNPETALSPLRHTPRQYYAYLEHLKDTECYAEDRKYWESIVKDLTGTPQFLLKKDDQKLTAPHTKRLETIISEEGWNLFEIQCRKHDVFVSSALYALVGAVIAKWSISKTFTINLPIQKRFFEDIAFDDLVTNASSFIRFTSDNSRDESCLELLQHSQKQIDERMHKSHFYGIDLNKMISEHTGQIENTSRIMFTSLLDLPQIPETNWRNTYFQTRTSQVWMDIMSLRYDSAIHFVWCYVSELLSDHSVTAMAELLKRLILKLRDANAWHSSINTLSATAEIVGTVTGTAEMLQLFQRAGADLSETYTLLDETGNAVCPGAIGAIYTKTGVATGFDGVSATGNSITILGKRETRILYHSNVLYPDFVECFLKGMDVIKDSAVVWDSVKKQLYLFYTAEKEISKTEWSAILAHSDFVDGDFLYKKVAKIYTKPDSSKDKKRLLKSISARTKLFI